ncbi:MAG: hypothetical protein HC925_01815 [Coleofasciculaceae cyanobacterium SM2_3_26]|nr:hypothetical protein [Coleofasciculaceae cyanobacterium SM2_3_26]
MQLSLVAYYGEKNQAFAHLIQTVQAELQRRLGKAFAPYSIEQIHATIVGLEGVREGEALWNRNFLQFRGERRAMDLSKLLHWLDATELLPFDVQLGGFVPDRPYPFTSRDRHPFLRSFDMSNAGEHGAIAVGAGWSRRGEAYTHTLDALRKAAQTCNLLHKYHRTPTDIDNDFYFALGWIDRTQTGDRNLQTACDAVRQVFANHSILLPVNRNMLSLALYEDPRFPPESTESIPLEMAEAQLERLICCYS